jgi:hypothetical protein
VQQDQLNLWGSIQSSCDLPRIQTVILGLSGILGRPKIPEFVFAADSESVLSFALALGPQMTVWMLVWLANDFWAVRSAP